MATQALTKREQTALDLIAKGPIANIVEFQARISELAEVANVLLPSVASQVIPPKQALALSAVQVDTSVNAKGQGPEVYFDPRFCEREKGQVSEVALGKVAILKILAAAGLEIVESRRLDDMSDPHYCNFQVRVAGRDMTGLWRSVPKSKELDLRNGAPETMQPEKIKDRNGQEVKTGKMVPKSEAALSDQRRHIQSLAETKALLKATRDFLGLRQKYTVAEASRLWIVPRLVPHYDMKDPEDREFARKEAAGHSRMLYGGTSAPQLEEGKTPPPPVSRTPHEPIEAEVVTTGGDGQGAKAGTAAQQARPAGSTPAPSINNGDPFELGDLASVVAEAEQPAIIVCLCPCGCQKEITAAVAEKTMQQLGTPRCASCFPGKTFDFAQHKDIDRTGFQLPNFKNLTLEQVRKSVQGGKK